MISADMVKNLREKTGAGMMDCKKVLTETDGDMEKAVELLRERGIAKAAKKADRIAAEGLVATYVSDDKKVGVVVEVNSETDFVAKNEDFQKFVAMVALEIAKQNPKDVADLLEKTTSEGNTIQAVLTDKIATIGENMSIRRFKRFETDGLVGSYVHGNGKIGVLVDLSKGSEEVAKGLAMHIAAMNPQVLSYTELDVKFVEDETKAIKASIEIQNEDNKRTGKPLLRVPTYVSRFQLTPEVIAEVKANLEAELKKQGKPEAIWNKIIPGQLEKFIKDNTELDQTYSLLSQSFVMDDNKTVEKYLEEVGANVTSFIRFEVGEGLEKKEENFAEEVKKQMGQ
ncbi:MAG: translation elongation factor Ts [Oscillospiraceae bacterium]|nr:translation elongation factor Ts [Oscillospiraceae bacterium]